MVRSGHLRSRAALWLTMICASFPAVAQTNDDAAALEHGLNESIAAEQAEHGAHSSALIPLFTELGHLYRLSGLQASAVAAYEEARGVVRANHGLSSLEEAPLLEEIIRIEEAQGLVQEPWRHDHELLELANAHRNDLRAVDIYRLLGDKRLALLDRYLAGEFPPQLVLGCYYHRAGADLPSLHSEQNCSAGSRGALVRAVTFEALRYYAAAVETLTMNQQYSSAELHELEQRLVSGTYDIGAFSFGRRSLQRLLSYDVANGEPSLTRVDSLLRIADWDIVRTQMRHDRTTWDSAVDTYEQVYAKLRKDGVDEESIRHFFAPDVPVVLPTFRPNPLVSARTSSARGHIDVAFEVTKFGRARRVEILDSTENASRDAERDLVQQISRSVFRPRVVDGHVADAARVEVRYYISQ